MNVKWRENLRLWTNLAPLFAAIIAPLSTLLDIPALTENWFAFPDGSSVPDAEGSLILSAFGLAFNVFANALIFARFTLKNKWWITVTRASIVCWFIKVVVACINFGHYGIIPGRDSVNTFAEGFWCAALSLLIATVILLLLLAHGIFHAMDEETYRQKGPTRSQLEMRVVGRTFMIQNTLFVAGMAILALFMSRLEHWTYFEGVYFSVITFLTIGFGDFVPTTTATKIVLLPFALFGIAQLGHLISMIAGFLNDRTASNRAQKHARWERKRQEQENLAHKDASLGEEMAFLQGLHRKQDLEDGMSSLGVSLGGVIAFWLIGALIFSQTEGWSYGDSLYFCYVFFLTIGYGDFAPNSGLTRVVFVVYALMVVPIMTSFAVQTMTSLIVKFTEVSVDNQFSALGLQPDLNNLQRAGTTDRDVIQAQLNGYSEAEAGKKKEDEKAQQMNEDVDEEEENRSLNRIFTHAEFVSRHHQQLRKRVRTARRSKSTLGASPGRSQSRNRSGSRSASGSGTREAQPEQEKDAPVDGDERPSRGEQKEERNLEQEALDLSTELTARILELALEMEHQSRRLLIGHMDPGSRAQILLKADRYVQMRETYALSQEAKKSAEETRDEGDHAGEARKNDVSRQLMKRFLEMEWDSAEGIPVQMDEMETLLAVRKYRHAFAGMLACGSRLLKLRGQERYLFERRRKEEDEESLLDFDEDEGDDGGEVTAPVEVEAQH